MLVPLDGSLRLGLMVLEVARPQVRSAQPQGAPGVLAHPAHAIIR